MPLISGPYRLVPVTTGGIRIHIIVNYRIGEQPFAQEHPIDLKEMVSLLNRLFQQQAASSTATASKDTGVLRI